MLGVCAYNRESIPKVASKRGEIPIESMMIDAVRRPSE